MEMLQTYAQKKAAMTIENLPIKPGTLRKRIRSATENARRSGKLHSIPTHSLVISDSGIDFLVRRVDSLADKDWETRRALDQAGGQVENRQNPFLPYDESMYVGHIGDNHVCLLNKFNVLDDHVLLVTRQFEHQDCLLSPDDFAALTFCLLEFDCLAFYNGGRIAGASQPHKHLQVVPLPFSTQGPAVPLEPAIRQANWTADLGRSEQIPFRHILGRPANPITSQSGLEAAQMLHALYHRLLAESPAGVNQSLGETKASPYNLLITRKWMLLVPRTREFSGTISLNALAFAGALLVRSTDQQQELTEKGCVAALKWVTE